MKWIALVVGMTVAGGALAQQSELQQCRLALQMCAANGPVPLAGGYSRSIPERSDEARAVNQAAQELADAADDLLSCARKKDPDDDCSRQARNARYAAEDYEDAISAYQIWRNDHGR